MSPSEKRIYLEAAKHAAKGWSANRSMKRFGFPWGTVARDTAIQGFQDMRTFMQMQEVYNEVQAEKAARETEKQA